MREKLGSGCCLHSLHLSVDNVFFLNDVILHTLLHTSSIGPDELQISVHLLHVPLLLDFASLPQPLHDEVRLSLLFDHLHLLHGLHGLQPDFTAVFDWAVSLLFELEGRVDGEFFAHGLSVGFGPFHLPRVLLLLERGVAFRAAELKDFAVVSYELNAVPGKDPRRAEIARINTHFGRFSARVLFGKACTCFALSTKRSMA